MSRVMHFEIHASDPKKLIEFYGTLLGWKFSRWGELDYWLIETGPADQPGINGGLIQRKGCDGQSAPWVNAYICTARVENLDATLARSATLGAPLALPKMPIQGVGWLAYIKDLDGNILGLMQPDAAAS